MRLRGLLLAGTGLLLAQPAWADYNSNTGQFSAGDVELSADQLNDALNKLRRLVADVTDKVFDRFAQRVNLADYVSDKTCGSDVTAGVKAAVNALPAIGGIIDVPVYCYKFGEVTYTKSVHWHGLGVGENQAVFQPTTPITNMLVASGNRSFRLDGIHFASPSFVRTGGSYVDASVIFRLRMRDFRMDNYYRAIRLNNVTASTIEDFFMWHPTPEAVAVDGSAFLLGDKPGGASQAYVGQTTISRGFISSQQVPDVYDTSYQPTTAFDVRTVDNLLVEAVYMGYQGKSFLVRPGAGGVVGQFATNVTLSTVTMDTARIGLYLIPGAPDATIAHLALTNHSLVAVMHDDAAIKIDATTGPVTNVEIVGSDIINNTDHYGIVTSGGLLNGLHIKGNRLTNNGIAVRLSGGSKIDVVDNTLGALDGSFAPENVTALQVDAGVSGRALMNRFGGNSTDIINNTPTTFFAAFNDPPTTPGQVATVGPNGLAVSSINVGVGVGTGNRAACLRSDGTLYAASGASCP